MREYAKVVHSVPGRVRIKIPAAKRNPHLLPKIKHSLASVRGVRDVAIQPASNSVVVHYTGHPDTQFQDALADHGRSTGLFDLAAPELSEVDEIVDALQREAEFLSTRSQLARSVMNATKSLDIALKKATNNNIDLKVLLPIGLAVYTVLEFGAEASTPLWVTLGIFSFNSFVALHPPLPDDKPEVLDRQSGSPNQSS